MKTSRTSICNAVIGLLESGARSAVVYEAPDLRVKATLVRYHYGKRGADIVLTIGRPNCAERKFIKDYEKTGVAFPLRKVQLKFKK